MTEKNINQYNHNWCPLTSRTSGKAVKPNYHCYDSSVWVSRLKYNNEGRLLSHETKNRNVFLSMKQVLETFVLSSTVVNMLDLLIFYAALFQILVRRLVYPGQIVSLIFSLIPFIFSAEHCYLLCPLFVGNNPQEGVSRSKILSLRPRDVKHNSKDDGLCPYCNRRAQCIEQLKRDFKADCVRTLQPWRKNETYPTWSQLKDHAVHRQKGSKAKLRKKTCSLLDELKSLEHHFALKTLFLEREKKFKENQPKNYARLIVDQKKPLVGGLGGPHGKELDVAWGSLWTCTVFGGLLQVPNNVTKQKQNIYKSILSLNKDHCSAAAALFTKKLMETPGFKGPLDAVTRLEVSHDSAGHFVSHEFAGFILSALPKMFRNLKFVTQVPFPPHHGKSDLDRHFSHMSSYLKVRKILLGTFFLKFSIRRTKIRKGLLPSPI